jgi:hypothetical protein
VKIREKRKIMEIVLKPSWILTNDHAASRYGQPVLVNRGSQEAYGRGDLVKAYPSWDYTPARMAVERMMKTCQLDEDELKFCGKFTR